MKTSHVLFFAATGVMAGLAGPSPARAQGLASNSAPAPGLVSTSSALASTPATSISGSTSTLGRRSARPHFYDSYSAAFFGYLRPPARAVAVSSTGAASRDRSAATSNAPPVPGLRSEGPRGAVGDSDRSPHGATSSRRALKAPPVPRASIHLGRAGGGHRASSRSSGHDAFEKMYAADSTGRHDLAGKPVGFYPSARSLAAAKSQGPAAKPHASGGQKENANRALGVDGKK